MPTTSGPRQVPATIAGELGDLYAIQHDLEAARSYCERVKREWQDRQDGYWVVIQGLAEAAVVRYTRCFASGRRLKLDDSWLPLELLEAHQAVWALRSKHVAHPVNDFEQVSVMVQVVESGGPREVHGVGMGVGQVGGLTPSAADSLTGLCDALLAALEPRIEQMRRDIEREVKALPVDEVYSWPEPEVFAPSGKQRPRRRTR